jgi:hypothetical protein
MIFYGESFLLVKFNLENFISIMPNYDGNDIFTSSPHGGKMNVNRVVLNSGNVKIVLD